MINEKVSIIIATYNRCPFPSKYYLHNPLVWCLLSIINGNYQSIYKIIVVDDFSEDFTEENITKIKKENEDVNLVYVKMKVKSNPSIVRNCGLKYANSEYVFFMDDDCIMCPDVMYKALKLYKYLSEDNKIGALHFPVYFRKYTYDGLISRDKIGKLYPQEGKIFTNFRMYPIEHPKKIRMAEGIEIEEPIKIDFFHEVFLISTSLIKKVDGFCENMKLNHILSEGLYLSMKFKQYNLKHYQIVDPSLKIIHFRYGSFIDKKKYEKYNTILPIPKIKVSLADMIEMSNVKNLLTGGRTSIEEIIKESISSRYAIFLYCNKAGAEKWKKYTYNALLFDEDYLNMLKFPKLDDIEIDRQNLWEKAIEQGREIYEQRLF